MEPAIQAVLHLQPNFDFSTIDLVTDRQSLVKLLELAVRQDDNTFAIPSPNVGDERTGMFNFWAQAVGNTIIFIASCENPVEIVNKFRGFRKEYDQTYLQYPEGMLDTDSHQSIITYRLGELRLMVRHPTNGYVSDDSPQFKEAMESFEPVCTEVKTYGNVQIISGGTLLPRSVMLELNTHKKDGYCQQGDRLNTKIRETWLSQQRHYFIAPYSEPGLTWAEKRDFSKRRAVFDSPLRYDAAELMSKWEEDNQGVIQHFYRRLLGLLEDIRFEVSQGNGTTFKIERTAETQEIKVIPWKNVPGLPEELCERLKKAF